MAINCSGDLSHNSGYGSAATAYGCRAWINFRGSGSVGVYGVQNLGSLTDNGTGDYSLSFSSAMPDTNYAVIISCKEIGSSAGDTTNRVAGPRRGTSTTTTTLLRLGGVDFGYQVSDLDNVYVAVFR